MDRQLDYMPDPGDGDVNGDGELSLGDVNAMIDIIVTGQADEATRARADLNGDGEVNMSDVNALINIILKQIAS